MLQSCQSSDHQRAELRIPLEREASLRHEGRGLTVRLSDLSRGGAALWALQPPPRGAVVTLELGPLAIAARVAWGDGRRFGLRFETRLRATDVFLLTRRSH